MNHAYKNKVLFPFLIGLAITVAVLMALHVRDSRGMAGADPSEPAPYIQECHYYADGTSTCTWWVD